MNTGEASAPATVDVAIAAELPAPCILRLFGENARDVAEVGVYHGKDGSKVTFVRVGRQWRTDTGEWRWMKGQGATIPLANLGRLAAWLIDAARAIPRPERQTATHEHW